MRTARLVQAAIAVLVCGTTIVAQPTAASRGQSRMADHLLMLGAWSPSPDQDLVCRVSEGGRPVGGLSTKILSLSRADVKSAESMFQFETPDLPLALIPLGETNSRLVTVWMGATGYHIRVFALVQGTVRKVLDTASRAFPEFRLDERSRESILVTELTLQGGEWSAARGNTEVFVWTGERYELIGRVPWKRRFNCINSQSCAGLK